MQRKSALKITLAIWAIAFFGAFVMWQLEAPTGSSFTRGMNRVFTFIGWQGVAIIFAIIAWYMGRAVPAGSVLRRASKAPLIAQFLLMLGIMAVIIWAQYSAPDFAPVPPRTPTAPLT